ncbi:MAG: hypothetical protein SFW08_06570 [Gemmatimonadaceae bacterium]|nr:hypothetical protein [Gemmatimonadaceae bacterium]
MRSLIVLCGSLVLGSCALGSDPLFPVGNAPEFPTGPFAVGTPTTDPDGWIEYVPGTMPLILVAPHGGLLQPVNVPFRSCPVEAADCTTTNDANTQDFARRLSDSIYARTRLRPHVIINLLHRNRYDGNRGRLEATGGNGILDRAWRWQHAFIDSAKATIGRQHGRGLLIDLHGHAHDIARLEWGYAISRDALNGSDAMLNSSLLGSSIARLAVDRRSGDSYIQLLRGPHSFGGLLQAAGYAGVPSPQFPGPGVDPYFEGGYNTQRHGSRDDGPVDAVQLEMPFDGVRDVPANRAAFASALTTATLAFLHRQYGYTP